MKPDPCTLVIFGASGDLTKRKLIPALYNLLRDGLLPEAFAVVGFARREMAHDQFRAHMTEDIKSFAAPGPVDGALWQRLAHKLFYVTNHFKDHSPYVRLRELLVQLDREHGTCGNRLFYLATPPSLFRPIAEQLGTMGLQYGVGDNCTSRLIVEKPFGHDLASAQTLSEALNKVFNEDQIYRIDHYTGKETVQNILVFRFANGIFEPVWNRRYIDHVQIAVAESLGVEGRGAYYDETGTLRDMVQNHMLQLLALVAMEPPSSLDADSVRDEKVKVLRSIQPWSPEAIAAFTVRGQYVAGEVQGSRVAAYREEPNVSAQSQTETYAAVRLLIDNWRWAGVPFFLRSGKRLARRASEVVIQFRRPPLSLFRETAVSQLEPNRLILNIQPDEGIGLRFDAKVPGADVKLQPVEMDFTYGEAFGSQPGTGYETLLYDAMLGDSTLFTRRDLVEASWRIATPILEAWQGTAEIPLHPYAAGSWGPTEGAALIEKEGRRWRTCD